MKKKFIFLLGLLFTASALALPNKIIIIRHGNKPEGPGHKEKMNLSCEGLHRALGLISYLASLDSNISLIYTPHIKPHHDYDPIKASTKESREFQTASPFAIVNDININTSYDYDDTEDLAADLQGLTGGDALVVWEHHNIHKLVENLGIKDKDQPNKGEWPKNDFDSVWIITYNNNGVPQITSQKENISPSKECSF